MTEASYQAARKVMQRANYLRGIITTKKGVVSKWSNIEDSHRRNLQEGKANGAKKLLDKAISALGKAREGFSKLDFPPSNMRAEAKETVQCEGCGASIAKGNTYCGECLCED